MVTLNKALTRPAMLFGIPMVPLVIVSGAIILLAIYLTKLLLLFLPVSWFVMNQMARKDAHIFGLAFLKLKTRGNKTCNTHYGATAFLANDYDAVDITEFINTMRLNERVTLTKHIPYSSHIHENVIKTRGSDLIATWEIGGTAFECDTEENLDILSGQFNNLIKSFEGRPVTFYVHNIRETYHDHFDGHSGNDFADTVSERYYSTIENHPFRHNRLFFTACYMPFVGLDKVERKRMSDGQKQHALDSALKEMLEICQTVGTSLSRFTANQLGAYEENGRVFSSQLSFYRRLLSGVWQKTAVTRTPFYETLGTTDLFFTGDAGQSNNVNGKTFFRGLEVKDYAPESFTGIMNVLLYAPCDYVITQSFTCMAKDEAQKHIKQTAKRLRSTEDDAISQQEDLFVALDMLQAGHIAFGKYHFSLMVSAPGTERLIKDTNSLINAFTDLGITPTLSTLSLPAAYLAQMPGVYTLRPRLVPISSQNFAELASFHNFYTGKRDKNPWGEALCVLKTPSGGAYYMNLHNSMLNKDDFNEKNLGNTSVIGTAGSGKTMLMAFIQVMMQKYRQPRSFSPQAKTQRLTTVYFDKDRGAELNVRALGGQYYKVKSGEPTGWNPFRLPPTKRNLNFIKKLMRILCTRNGQTLFPRDELRLSQAVDAVMKELPAEHRGFGITRLLENLTEPPTKEAQENGLRVRLSQWAQGGEYGWVFDNDLDTFDIGECDNFGIDGTEFLDDADVCAPISFYLLYRVTSLLDGRRLVIFMDEFWKWLNDPVFSDFAFNVLKVIRKLNGVFIPGTQSPAEILINPISPAVVEQCGTQIFTANPKADRKDYVDGLKVAPEIFDIIKNLDPLSRQFVIVKSPLKKGDLRNFAALVTLDLSGLGTYTKVLSSSADNLEIFDSVFQDGMKPDDWLERYLQLAL
ncbi:VirB3 family type IV secretion system protein [Yersinia enterocolitica]|jgi:type IV secretion system protein VirB4|uniref:VirB3 family type IV secretion system protein n=4 Tax=Enterobacterales TaxID=91347 RepID=A0A7W3HBM0_CITFR|nr:MULTISPECIES: VirB3 family type IV secretion system protein [Enterobacterales]KAA0536417.1 ATPase [Citrobacter portucalensis]MBD0808199.1 VirB3 family type IV secretion system protein [Citrobacter sp. C13]MDW5508175.1 VirB3 family type IV secretion system protein [Pseudomonas lundensis]QLU74804.1 VirB3 family type IV secretion system protein [Enterobacter cloacae]QLU94909.1 VirB3 family type IV secretion system protein [Enterobacter roggenkampii]CNM05259.1 TriC protein [Yersinia frederikse